MKILSSYALAVCGAVAILAGCSAGAGPSSALGYSGLSSAQRGALSLGHRHNGSMSLVERIPHPDHQKSWSSPELKKDVAGQRQLWISDIGTDDVYMYSLPSLTLVNMLTGFDEPQGECSDNAGHVWLTNTGYYTGNHVIYEYDHSGTKINTLTDPTGLPVGCAWDKTTGNLAVTNIFNDGPSQPPGEVLIYANATGTPRAYTDPDPSIYAYFYAAYDGKGNLYFDDAPYSYTPAYVNKLPKNANTVSRITMSGPIYGPGAVQWLGTHGGGSLMVEDTDCSGTASPYTACLDYITLSGPGRLTGTITSSAGLDNYQGVAACLVSQAVRSGNKVYAGDYEFSGSTYASCTSATASTTIDSWSYPTGGLPLRSAILTSSNSPDGTAISSP
jgi:hypothetical protein